MSKLDKLLEGVEVEWKTLGTQLDISAAKIKEIDVNNRSQVAECKHDMVQFWLESDSSCSWKKLLDALNMCDQSVLAKKIRETNFLPAACGRVCPQDKQCQAVCVVGRRNLPVGIGDLERYAADYERKYKTLEYPDIPEDNVASFDHPWVAKAAFVER